MLNVVRSLVLAGLAFFRARRRLTLENLALRHQLGVLKRSVERPRLTNADRSLWVLLSRRWASWTDALIIVKLDHVIVLKERHLRRLLRGYVSDYYHPCRTHLSLGKDAPEPRPVDVPEMGRVVELPLVGGLHHRYALRAA